MANRNLFASKQNNAITQVANAVNRAGGKAYNVDDKNALAIYVSTGCLNGTYYTDAKTQLEELKSIIKGCDSQFIAKAAVYGHRVAKMKDLPAYMLAELTARYKNELLSEVFNSVISNTKMLRNYVQIVRSGVLGRKSFGTRPKKLIQTWLNSRDVDRLFYDSVGDSPSLGDVIKLTRPKPTNKKQETLYRYLIGKELENKRNLPSLLKSFEDFKAKKTTEVPAVDFRRLTSLGLTTEQWTEIGYNSPWNMLRMNLNTFLRHGCFNDKKFTDYAAKTLADSKLIRQALIFPYQLFTAFKNVDASVPQSVKNALQEAMEVATRNVPNYNKSVVVAVDTSGSMQSPVTGHRGTATSKVTCCDVAALIASSILRSNKETAVVPFDTGVKNVTLNPFDSVMTNTAKLSLNGGGTDCSSALRHLNSENHRADLVIYVSDNESWYTPNQTTMYGWSSGKQTAMVEQWNKFKEKNRKAKLICIDLTPNRTVQVPGNKDVLNVAGMSNDIFRVIENFSNGNSQDFAQIIENWSPPQKNSSENPESSLDNDE
jgi:60 kDa SS-A/Ro ribonucleoprotein